MSLLRAAALGALILLGCGTPGSAPSRSPLVVLITAGNLRADFVDLADEKGLTPQLAKAANNALRGCGDRRLGQRVAGAGISAQRPATDRTRRLGLGADQLGPTTPWLPAQLERHGVTTRAWVGRPALDDEAGWGRGFSTWQRLARLRAVRTVLSEPPPDAAFLWIDLPGARPPWHQATFAVANDPHRERLPLRFDPAEVLSPGTPVAAGDATTARALYRHAVASADTEIGELIDAALSGPRAADTTVIVTSDCGYRLGEDGRLGVGHGLDRVDVVVPLLVLGQALEDLPPAVEPSLLDLAPSIAARFGVGSIPSWRRNREIALIETPVSNGWRAAAAVGSHFQLRRQELWGDAAADPLHPDSLSPDQLQLLLDGPAWQTHQDVWRSWAAASTQVVASSAVPPAAQTALGHALDPLTAPQPGRVVDQRRLRGHGSRDILTNAPDNGASGP